MTSTTVTSNSSRIAGTGRGDDDFLRVGYFWPTSRSTVPTAYVCAQNPDALDLVEQERLAKEIEEAGFDFGLLSDGYGVVSENSSRIGHHDPSIHAILWALPLFGVTSRLGLISTMHTTFMEVIDLAQFGAQLDNLSGGRWGWNVTTGYREAEPRLFGADGLADHDERYGIAEESLAAVRELWERGATALDGRYRRLRGSLPGPLPITRPGPLIVNAGASEQGLRVSGRYCDYVFTGVVDHRDVEKLKERMRVEAEAAGRRRSAQVLVLVNCFLRDDEGEAQDEWAVIQETMDASAANRAFNQSMAKGSTSIAQNLARSAEGSTGRGSPISAPLVGTPASVASQMVDLYHDYGYRGFLLSTPYWGIGEMARYGQLFQRLEESGVWCPSSKRDSLW